MYYRKGAIMADVSEETKNQKVRLHKKRDYDKENKQKMMKYYTDPEKQERLRQRIKEYEDQAKLYTMKADELKQFLISEN